MYHIILVIFFALPCTLVAQSPFPSFPPPPTNQAPILQPVSNNSGPVKPDDQVRVLHGTYIRSGPGEQAYSCGVLEAGAMVTILDFPAERSDYTPIAAPNNCYALMPESSIYHFIRPKTLFTAPQKTLSATATLIDGEPANGQYLSSGFTLPKGSLVSVVSEKKIKINGKEKVYCVIRIGGKEKRFVRTADLEGVAEAAKAASMSMKAIPNSNNPGYSNHRPSTEPLYGTSTSQQTLLEQEHLPPQLAGQVQTADQAYRTAMQYGAWEDARQRYQYLLECDVLSIRILAKNRLEFISQLQKNPMMVTTAMSPQQGASGYPATMNTVPWVPGSIAPARPSVPASSTSAPLPPKDIVIRPTQPVAPPANSAVNIPMYQGTPNAAQPSGPSSPPPGQVPARPMPAATPASAQRMKTQGRLNRAVQYDGTNQLYYLTNSQGFMIYYVRGIPQSGVRLNDYLNKYIEVEGWGIQASIDGQLKPQINVDRVRPLQ